jgi:Ankyrin repeats (3 copies)
MCSEKSYETIIAFMERGYWGEAIEELQENPELALMQIVDNHGYVKTLLHSAACFGGGAGLVDLLLRLGAKPNHVSEYETPLSLAIKNGNPYGLTTDENIRLLAGAGADLKIFDLGGRPPLQQAVHEKREYAVRILLSAGADPFQKNEFDEDVFAYMHEQGDFSMKEIIDMHIAEVIAKRENGSK